MGGVQEEAGTPPDAMAMAMARTQAQAGALAAVVVKGKRSKRRRVAVIAAAESSSAATEGSSSRSGADEAASGCVPEEEEEDMALCLMLLARGGHGARPGSPAQDAGSAVAVAKEAKFRSRRPVDGAAGEFVYECKTCNKCFSSFQALGGHRTSHKKPRLAPPLPPTTPSEDKKPAVAETTTAEEKPPPSPVQATTYPTVLAIPVIPKQEVGTNATTITIMSSSKQPRVHECSICGAEFASGQALGGHMRRHRPLVTTSVSAVDDGPRKEKSLLELDLNMPAPCDDGETSATSPPPAFAFAVKERSPLLFPASASALVDCHY